MALQDTGTPTIEKPSYAWPDPAGLNLKGSKLAVLNLCLFLPTGRTYTFRNVSILHDNENVLSIAYTAMSDSLYKTGTFQKSQIVGYSTWCN